MSHQVEASDAIPPEVLAEGYETRDLNVPIIWAWTVGVVVVVSLSYVVLNELYAHTVNQMIYERVLSVPATEVIEKNAAEMKVLHSSGVVDKDKGLYRVPINVAVDKVIAEDAARRH